MSTAASRRSGSDVVLAREVLPHRPPFLFVDEVIDVVPLERARGRWHLTGDEPFFAGHFPGRPTLPGVLMVEAMAQLGGVALLSSPDHRALLPLFGGIDRARFRRVVRPGDTLDMEVVLDHIGSSMGKATGRAWVDGSLACEARMLFVITPSEPVASPGPEVPARPADGPPLSDLPMQWLAARAELGLYDTSNPSAG